jgi:hypothetical protein
MKARTRLRLTLALGVLLSLPAVRTYLNGSIAIDAAAIRVGIAMLLAGVAVSALASLVGAYAPKAADEPALAIEDADLVDDGGAGATGEPAI